MNKPAVHQFRPMEGREHRCDVCDQDRTMHGDGGSVELVRLNKMEELIAQIYAQRHGFHDLPDVRPAELLYIIATDAKVIAAELRAAGYVT